MGLEPQETHLFKIFPFLQQTGEFDVAAFFSHYRLIDSILHIFSRLHEHRGIRVGNHNDDARYL